MHCSLVLKLAWEGRSSPAVGDARQSQEGIVGISQTWWETTRMQSNVFWSFMQFKINWHGKGGEWVSPMAQVVRNPPAMQETQEM